MGRNKKTVLTEEIVWQNHEDYLDTIVSELNCAQKKEKIAKFSGIVDSYLDYLALPEQDPELAWDVRWTLPVFYNFLGELHASLNEPGKAFQAYSASFQLLRRDNRTDSFDQLEEYIDFLIKYRRFDVLPDVIRFITPKIFNFEGYERAERLYRKLDAVDALKDAVPEELHRFRFLLGLTVPEELSRAEHIMFLLNNYLYNFAKDILFGMSEEDFRALPTDGEASLMKIMQQFDLFNTDEDDGEEPLSYVLEDNPFYERVARVLTETCSVEALEEYRAFCEAHNMKWRIPSILKMIFDKVSGARQ